MALDDKAVVDPNYGLYLGKDNLALNKRSLSDGLNFRVAQGMLNNINLGWDRFGAFTLSGAVTHITNFFLSDSTEHMIFCSLEDIYLYDAAAETVAFLNLQYDTGTVSATGDTPGVVTGTGTAWDTAVNSKKPAVPGDKIHFGAANQNDPDAVWYTIATTDSDTQITLTTAISGGAVSGGTAYTIRKVFTGRLIEPFVSTTFVNASPGNADLIFLSNGIDNIVTWNGTDATVTDLDTLGFTARQLGVYSNMMIYGDILQGGIRKLNNIINSDLGTPENVTTGLASQFVVHDGTDPVVAIEPLGENLIIYSEKHVTPIQFVGDPLVFIFRDALAGQGPLASRAIVNFGNFHEFLSAESQHRFDGVNVTEVNAHLWRDALRTRDPIRDAGIFTHIDEENGDVVWAFPLVTDTGSAVNTTGALFAYSAHYLEEVPSRGAEFGRQVPMPYSKREFPFSASGFFTRQTALTWDQISDTWADHNFRWNDNFFSVAFPLNMVGDTSGKIYTLGTSQDADGSALASFVRFGRRAVGDGIERGLVKRIYPFATEFPAANYNLDVTLHLSDHANGSTTASEMLGLDLTLPESTFFVSHFRRARFIELEFGTSGPTEPWELAGYAVDAVSGGRR